MWGAVGGLGIAAGVLVGGVITTWAGWQAIFWVNVPIGVGAVVAALVLLPRTGPARSGLAQLDLPVAVAAVTGLGALVFGIQTAASDGLGITENRWCPCRLRFVAVRVRIHRAAGTATAGAAAHLAYQDVVSGTGVMLGVTGLLVGAVFLGSIFFQTTLGYSALEAGLAFLPLALILIVGTRLGSHLLGLVPPRMVAAGGLLLAAGGTFWLSTAPADARYAAALLPGLLVLGVGVGLVFVAVSITAMAEIPGQHAGMAFGFLMTGHEIGAALGVAVLAAVATAGGDLTTRPRARPPASPRGSWQPPGSPSAVVFAFLAMPARRTTGQAHLHMH